MEATIYGAGLPAHPAGVLLRTGLYLSNQRPSIHLVCASSGSICGSLTVNLPAVDLADGHIVVSGDWNVSAELKAALLASGQFVRAGRSLMDRFGLGDVWRITSPALLAEIDELRHNLHAHETASA